MLGRMAPEMMVGERCSNKTDIFSFGVVLWEIVTQVPPVPDCMPASQPHFSHPRLVFT